MNKLSKWSGLALVAVLTATCALTFGAARARADECSPYPPCSQYGGGGPSGCSDPDWRYYDSRAYVVYQNSHGRCNDDRDYGNYSYREYRLPRPRYHGTWENWSRGRQGRRGWQGQRGWRDQQGWRGQQGQDRRWKGRNNVRDQNDPRYDPRWDNSNQDQDQDQGNRSH